MFTFFGFVSFVIVFWLVFGLRSRMRLVELRVYGASPIPVALKGELEDAARAAAAEAYARSVAAAGAAAAARDEALRRVAAERVAAEQARRPEARASSAAATSTAVADRPAPMPPHPFPRDPDPLDPAVSRPAAAPSAPTPTPTAPRAATTARAATTTARPPKKINWELFAGGRLMNVAGAIALVIGFGLLLKYAFDQNWINAQLRIAFGVVAGAIAIGSGMAVGAKRKTWFVHGVFGTGIGIWYASGYAAFAGYHLVPALAAYAFMVGVTVAAFAIALRYDSIAVALVGWAGGFVVPFVAGSAGASEIALASYLVLLDAGLLAITLARRRWFVLQPLALAASYVVAVAWYLENGSNAPAVVSAIAIASLWLVFFAAETLGVLREPGRRVALKTISSLVNLAASATCLAALLGHTPIALEVVTAIAAAGYGATYAGVLRFASVQLAYRYLYAFSAAALALSFVLERFHGATCAIVLAGIGIAVGTCSRVRRGKNDETRVAYEALAVSFGAYVLALFVRALLANEHALAPARFGTDAAPLEFLDVALAVTGFALDRLWRHARVSPVVGVVSRIAALGSVVLAERQYVAGASAGIAFAVDALAIALAAYALRLRGLAYGVAYESTIAAATFLAFGALAIAAVPDGSARDAATIVWTLTAFALAAIPDGGSAFETFASIGFRSAGFLGAAEFAWTHVTGYALASVYAAGSIVVAAIERATRGRSQRRLAPSAFVVASFFVTLATVTWLVAPDAFAAGAFRVAFDGRDGALLACIVAIFALDRLSAGSAARPVVAGPVLRALGLFGIVTLDAIHLHGNALATTLALEALGLAAVDRALHLVRAQYAPAGESFASGIVLGAAAAFSFGIGAIVDPSSFFAVRTLAFGWNGVDLALAMLAATALAYGRVAASRGIAGPVTTVLRQCATAVAFVAVAVHFDGFERSDGFAVLAIGLSIAASRTRALDLRIDGALALAFGLVELAIARSLDPSSGGNDAGTILGGSFACFTANAIATIVASESYRRSAGAIDALARGGRIAGALLAIVGITFAVHDAFERVARATASAAEHARIENLEQLTVSIGWIAASIVLVAIGIRLRIREFRLVAIGLFDLTMLKAFFVDVYALETPYRIVSFIVLGATLMAVSYAYGRFERRLFGTDGSAGDVARDDADVPFSPAAAPDRGPV